MEAHNGWDAGFAQPFDIGLKVFQERVISSEALSCCIDGIFFFARRTTSASQLLNSAMARAQMASRLAVTHSMSTCLAVKIG